ncbi:hypothetical protein [Immundisolibacter cernigliae]|uniref:hypothetical protein n=1 Tax=Immundisolibacter cernigliae TaxID=1810504 RepID=UPI001F39D0B6|nr:hypothetical protein [Immundisolibacter cernigliae]
MRNRPAGRQSRGESLATVARGVFRHGNRAGKRHPAYARGLGVLTGDTVRAAAALELPLVVSLGSQRVCDESESRRLVSSAVDPDQMRSVVGWTCARDTGSKVCETTPRRSGCPFGNDFRFAEVTPAVSGARGFRHRRKVWDEVMYPVGSAQSAPVVTWMGKAGAGTALIAW